MDRIPLALDSLERHVGQEVAVSPWYEVAQGRIARFADATDDHQWIHVDPERARSSPFGTTIAHGFLTLSLLKPLADLALEITGCRMGLNYGLDRLRFPAPLPAGARIRARFTVGKVDRVEGGAQVTWKVIVEREGGAKPCVVAEWLVRYYA